MKKILAITIGLLTLALTLNAALPIGRSTPAPTAQELDTDTWIAANLVLMFVTNKGSFAYDQGGFFGRNDGLYFPFSGDVNGNGSINDEVTNSNSHAIFASGMWLGGVVNGETRVTVAEYSDDFWPGQMENGTFIPTTDTDPAYRVYKLYADSMADNPNQDYLDWPVDQGAPVDSNGNPELIGDVMCWAVYNDANPTPHVNNASSALGLGIEVRQTTFAFSREGALSNIVFLRFRLYNKGGNDISDMFLSLWADPDLGNAGDDFVGSDTSLSLGYCYNDGDDSNYGAAPPAVGYDFFQGPLIFTGNDADTAIAWDFTRFPQYRNLPMTSFNKYINGTDPDSPEESYQYMRGLDAANGGIPLIDPNGDTTKFFGAGDPVTGTGWLDANSSDRRYMLSTGPFEFPAGDSTEIVAAIVLGQGGGPLSSITVLRTIDAFAQRVYNDEFQLPDPPAQPDVTVAELDQELVIKWGNRSEVENGDYDFEGYAVLQGPSPTGPWTDTLVWADVRNGIAGVTDLRFEPTLGREIEVLAKPGTDDGLQHYVRVTRDLTGGGPLVNYRTYYYRIEAYSVDTAAPAGFKTLTSATQETVMPRPSGPGRRLDASVDDELVVGHPSGQSDGEVVAVVVDPNQLTGDDYEVTFEETPDGIVWHLINTTTGDTVLADQMNQAGDDNYLVVDGIQVRVSGPPLLGKDWEYESASPLNVSPVAQADNGYTGGERWFTGGNHGGELLFGGVFMEPNFWGATTLGPADYKVVEIRWRPMQSYTDANGDGEFTIGEPFVVDDPSQTQGAFMYQTFAGSAYEGFFDVPFTAWDVSDPNNPRQLNVVVRDRDANQAWNLHVAHDPATTDTTGLPNGGDLRFNYTWILNTDYDASGTMYGDGTGGTIDFWAADGGAAVYDAMWVMWLDERGSSRGMLAEECTFRLIPNFVNAEADVFTFSTTGFEPVVSETGPESELEQIKPVPNPYYLFSEYDETQTSRRMKFTNMPEEATISIYNLSGELIRTIEKTDPGPEAFWDIENAFGVPVASGIYIYVIDAPGFGQKIGKLAIFTEIELLDQF